MRHGLAAIGAAMGYRTLVVDLFQESHKFVSYDMQYHHCHAKKHFTNNWVCQIL